MSKNTQPHYIGRFAPSPTGPLHAGSLVAALASWLDAKAHGGLWLVRIEDGDVPRCVVGADRTILQQLNNCGLHPDQSPIYQSQRGPIYQAALDRLVAQQQAYACGCSRQDIQAAVDKAGGFRARGQALIYPGTCRQGLAGKAARSWRFNTDDIRSNKQFAHIEHAHSAIEIIANPTVDWTDRRLGRQSQKVERDVGDFVLKRADGLWAYQLAVVVDDAGQDVTHIVRGADLLDNTARQILLQRALGLPQPDYLHTPVVSGTDGEKLSKQNGATAVDTSHPLTTLQNAGAVLGITLNENHPADWLAAATRFWQAKYVRNEP